MERITLRSGALEAQFLPDTGGSLARFDLIRGGVREPILRGTDEAYTDVLAAACFPLVPFANRIRDGRFMCDGVEVRLAPNMAGDASPLHGQGWLAPWTVVRRAENNAHLLYEHIAGEWPWDYEARLEIVLDDDSLSVRLSCRNLSDRRMPCGLGFHPYFPCTAQTVLDTVVTDAWTVDREVLPVEKVPATGKFDLCQRPICGQNLDNGFDGWSGTARIVWPERRLALMLSSPDAPRFQVYSPATGGLFVAEPVQNANAALNASQDDWAKLGVVMLEQGHQTELIARFQVTSLL